MKVDTQAFPYPVLTEDGGSAADFVDSAFEAAIESSIEGDKNQIWILSYKFNLSNEAIHTLIEMHNATYALEIKCSDTLFRKVFRMRQEGRLEIPSDEIFGKVEITPMIVITHKINGFSSDDLNEEFGNNTFSLEPGDVVAINSTLVQYFDFNPLKFESLVKVKTSDDIDPFSYSIHLDSEAIYIIMGRKMREGWNNANQDKNARPYLAMSVYKDCVLVALGRIISDKDIESRKWARALNSKLAESNISLPSDDADLDHLNLLAQKITSSIGIERLLKILNN